MKVPAIDMDALHASAFAETGEAVIGVSRAWLRDVHSALSGAPFVPLAGAATFELRTLGPVASHGRG